MSRRDRSSPRLWRAACAACAIALCTAARTAAAAPLYSVLDLGPTADSLTVTGLSARGQVSYHTTVGGITSALRTEPNSPFNLDTDALGTLGGFSAQALGVNGQGQAVGASETLGGPMRGFRTAPQQPIDPATDDLGSLGGPSSVGSAINDRGQVAGYSETTGGVIHAFRTAAHGAIDPVADDLGTLGGTSSATAINNRGQVIGESRQTVGGPVRGFRTAPDAPIRPATDDLGSLGGVNTFARGINRHGQVVGFSNAGGGASAIVRAFRTQPGAAIDPATDDLGTLGGANSFAVAINDRGEVVGQSQLAGAGSHAFVTARSGVMLDLNAVLDYTGAEWELLSARAVNNHGQILVIGHYDPDGEGPEPAAGRAALLTPARQTATAEWNSPAGGLWAAPANWQGGVPDSAGNRAKLTGSPAASAVIELGGDRTIGHLEFAPDKPTAGGYVIAGSGSLTFRNGLELATLSASEGQHRIAALLVLSDDLRIDIAAGASVSVAHPLVVPATMILTKAGAGSFRGEGTLIVEPLAQLRVSGGDFHADALESEGVVIVSAGAALASGRIWADSLSVAEAGVVRLTGGGPTGSRIRFLNISGEPGTWAGRFDVGEGALVLQSSAADRANRLAVTTDQVRHARNTGGSRWAGAGITSSAAAADLAGLTAVGVLLNDDGAGNPLYTTFAGLPVDANSILLRATWAGDLDLNGIIDIADYFRLDRGWRMDLAGYANGDADYSGSVDADDYTLTDRAFLLSREQDVPLAPAAPAAVPEPASVLVLLLTLARLGRRM